MDLERTLLLILAGMFAGRMNALAGGGSLITFPSLIMTGLPACWARPRRCSSRTGYAAWPGIRARSALVRALT